MGKPRPEDLPLTRYRRDGGRSLWEVPADARLVPCGWCSEPIWWVQTPRGKAMSLSKATACTLEVGEYRVQHAEAHFSDCDSPQNRARQAGRGRG